MNKEKGFVISDEDLKIFAEWIKKPESVQKILEGHSKVLDACKRIDKMSVIDYEMIRKPLIPIL